MASEQAPSSPQVIVCGGHPEVRFAMATALLAHDLSAISCETAEVDQRWGAATTTLVVVLTRSLAELELIERATVRQLRVIAVHGPTDVRGAAEARRAGASVLLPRVGRTTPLVDAVRGRMDPVSASDGVGLPDQPSPGASRAVRSHQ